MQNLGVAEGCDAKFACPVSSFGLLYSSAGLFNLVTTGKGAKAGPRALRAINPKEKSSTAEKSPIFPLGSADLIQVQSFPSICADEAAVNHMLSFNR
jgi:hypothetical protein